MIELRAVTPVETTETGRGTYDLLVVVTDAIRTGGGTYDLFLTALDSEWNVEVYVAELPTAAAGTVPSIRKPKSIRSTWGLNASTGI